MTCIEGCSGFIADILKSPHYFSTRIGGVSDKAHTASLNLAFDRGDTRETVIENLICLADSASFDPESIVSVPQIHSDIVVEIKKEHRGMGYFRDADFSCDGYVTTENDVTLGVKTADCVPILLEARDENGNVIAVSALHAGWRGTAARIAERGVEALIRLGGEPERIFAAIGPCIGQCCFEVGQECRDELAKIDETLIKNGREGKYFPDLAALNKRVLENCSVPSKNIAVLGLCTFCHEELFYSHRRQNGIRGSMLSVIRIRKG